MCIRDSDMPPDLMRERLTIFGSIIFKALIKSTSFPTIFKFEKRSSSSSKGIRTLEAKNIAGKGGRGGGGMIRSPSGSG